MKLLFERLTADGGEFDLKRAILNNVQRLVGTRVDDDNAEFDVLNCGLPSVVELAGGSRPAIERYGARLHALLAHYEPRLRETRVDIDGHGDARPFRLIVSGTLETGAGSQRLSFPVALRAEG